MTRSHGTHSHSDSLEEQASKTQRALSKPSPSLFQHPLMGTNLKTLLKTLRTQGGVSPTCWPHVLVFLASALARSPFREIDRLLMRRGDPAEAVEPPVFIVGYWRSGTTHLHNLLGCSPEFGIITPLASGLPWELLTLATWLQPVLERALPEDREVDDVAVTPQSPQEDEIPVANMQPLSVFHALYFPRHFRRNFERGVFLSDTTEQEVERWKQQVQSFLAKVAKHQENQPLLVKNPVYTARVGRLREMWPEARFIHIYRNPYAVYKSTTYYFEKMLSTLALQAYSVDDVEPVVLDSYPRMLDRLSRDTDDLPDHQFAEVRFEDLEEQPLDELERLYRQLDLPGWERARPVTENYLAGVADYSKNEYTYDAEVRATVQDAWGRFVERWEYDMPDG